MFELESGPDRTAAVGHLAHGLGLPVPAGDARHCGEQLAAAWQPRPAGTGAPARIVLDNGEHLEDLPALLDAWLDAAPALQIVVTSRRRLGAAHEQVLALAGLAVPDEASRDAEAALAFDAVRLFALRAGAAQRDFDAAAHAGSIVRIVQRLGGLPLAIELAASWVRLLPPARLADDLEASLDWLERDPAAATPAARPAHASLEGVLAQSFTLLAPSEREALAALAVFESGCTPAAARAVAGVSLPLLAALADRSPLAADGSGRFVMHPVVAAFARERLAALAPHARGAVRLLIDGVLPELANTRARPGALPSSTAVPISCWRWCRCCAPSTKRAAVMPRA